MFKAANLVDQQGARNTSPNWVITGDHSVQIRAERSGKNQGRFYAILVQAMDQSGNAASKTVVVSVTKGT